jgi:excisionase family DNA binding protein
MENPSEQSEQTTNQPESSRECLPGFLTVREAARIIGVSERSVYSYVRSGKLSGTRIGHTIVVSAEHARAYERKAPGRVRVMAPDWHRPPPRNCQYLTTIKLRVRPEQDELLTRKLDEIRTTNRHLLPGTAARYIARDPYDTASILIVLIWRRAIMPSEEEREAALSADFADVLAWEQAVRTESRVLLHA